jgi:CRP-like cAMP-binding protein
MHDASASILELIQGWKWFAYVSAEAHQWLAARASTTQVLKGQRVYAAGDRATNIYAVIQGAFRIYLTSSRGDEITLEEVVAGGWFPHIVPSEKPIYALNCVCLQDSTVFAVPVGVMSEFARRWPGYYQGLYHEFTNRATATFGRIELLSLHNLNVRLAVYLLRMAHLRGVKKADGSIWVPVADSQSEIAARVGGTRQRVNGILKVWSNKGLIEPHKDGTRILDVDRLKAEAKKSGFDLEEYLAGWHGGWGHAPK